MNIKIVLIVLAVVALAFAGWKFSRRVDRSDPIAVATAYTKALKAQNVEGAAKYYLPDKADAWREATDDSIAKMRSNAMKVFFEAIPGEPNFSAPTAAPVVKGAPKSAPGASVVQSADKSLTLEMTQISGNWYVSKGPI